MLIGVQRPTGGDRGLHQAFERVVQCLAWEDAAQACWDSLEQTTDARLFDPTVQRRLKLADAVLTTAQHVTLTATDHLFDALRDSELGRKTA